MRAKRELHLGYNVLADGMHPAAWRAPYTDPVGPLTRDWWVHVAKVAERGTFDAVFLADSPSLWSTDKPGRFEPTILHTYLAAKTERIGLIATLSSSFESPYNLARRVASLDHLSGGRVAWNVVTNAQAQAAANFSAQPHLSREDRYRKSEEFVEVVRKLWDSWEDDAVVADQASGVYADADRVHQIDHHGEFFDVAGPLTVPRSPQGQPVIFQAGGSPSFFEAAARSADAVFCALGSIPHARSFGEELHRRMARHGRSPDSIRIMPGLAVVLGGTEAEAHRRFDELNQIAGEDRLVGFARQLGVEPDVLSWDGPLPQWLIKSSELSSTGSQGGREIILDIARRDPSLTARQLMDRVITTHRLVVGTPEQVADSIEEWFQAGVVDGFNIQPDVNPSGGEAFVEHVVPLLRARGIFRHEYAGTTLREHLGLPRPLSRYAEAAVADALSAGA
ncbi:MAG: NtaA/DmoA family FMN-dependent monooxygenase [Solirubrobacteraceae bacterium]